MRRALVAFGILLSAGCGPAVFEEHVPPVVEETPHRGGPPPVAVGPPVPRVIEPYRIKPLDEIEVAVFGEEDMTRKIVVGPDGRLSYFLAEDIVAAGRTFAELRAAIREKLKEYFIAPQVCITGLEFAGNTVSILGQVRKPGTYVVGSTTRLLDLIAMAGGMGGNAWYPTVAGSAQMPMEFADLEGAFVLRKRRFLDVEFKPIFNGDEAACARNNILLLANDTVYIPSTASLDNKVFVLGEVSRPRVVRFGKTITLLEAVAEAGGLRMGARYRRALVVRGSLKDPAVSTFDLNAVRTGSAADTKLEPGDIVYVPKTALKSVNEIASLILPGLNAIDTADIIISRH